MKEFYKTDHFQYRQWDRKIDDSMLKNILGRVNKKIRKKTFLIVGTKILKKYGMKINTKTNLIIITKGNVLITLFVIEDLYNYLKTTDIANTIILN